MIKRTLRSSVLGLLALVTTAGTAWALGFQLSETKEQLGLKYDVATTDHGTGRVAVNLRIADAGRLKPLSDVKLVVPSPEGTGYVDLSLSLATREEGGKQVARVHLKKELAERAEIHLTTSHLDGQQSPRTWYYHVIPVARSMKSSEPKKN